MKNPAAMPAAIIAAQKAGKVITEARNEFNRLGLVTKTSRNDLRTDTDIASQRHIIKVLKERTLYRIYAEESRKNGEYIDPSVPTWIIDPLDGTTNFVMGFDHVAVAIALMYEGKVELGVVHDVFLGRKFMFDGERSWCTDRSGVMSHLRVCGDDGLVSRMIAYDTPSSKERMGVVHSFMTRANQVMHPPRIMGSAAIMLCFLARGNVGGYVNAQLDDWDVAAALPIVEKAGGVLTDWHGKPWQPHGGHHGIIAAATPEIHSQLLRIARAAIKETGFDPNQMK